MENRDMAHHHLGSANFVTSPARDKLASLRNKYMKVGEKYRTKFLLNYSTYRTVDDLFQAFQNEIESALSETVNIVASDISANRVYDTDLATIRDNLTKRVETVSGSFDRVQERYYEILGKAAELDAQRTAARENRGHIVGGGFGVEGALGGMAMATAANAAIGLLRDNQDEDAATIRMRELCRA